LAKIITKFRREWNDGGNSFVVPMIHGTNLNAGWSIANSGFATVATLDEGYFGRGIYFTSKYRYAETYSFAANAAAKPSLPVHPPSQSNFMKSSPQNSQISLISTPAPSPSSSSGNLLSSQNSLAKLNASGSSLDLNKLTASQRVFLIALVTPGNAFPVVEDPFSNKVKKIPSEKGFFGKTCLGGYQSHYAIVKSGFPSLDITKMKEESDELVVFQDAQALPLFLVVVDLAMSKNKGLTGIKKEISSSSLALISQESAQLKSEGLVHIAKKTQNEYEIIIQTNLVPQQNRIKLLEWLMKQTYVQNSTLEGGVNITSIPKISNLNKAIDLKNQLLTLAKQEPEPNHLQLEISNDLDTDQQQVSITAQLDLQIPKQVVQSVMEQFSQSGACLEVKRARENENGIEQEIVTKVSLAQNLSQEQTTWLKILAGLVNNE